MRISKNKLTQYISTLSKRDKAVLQSIKRCSFIKTDQIHRLHFYGSTTATAGLRATTRTLMKLCDFGLIQPLKRRIGGVRAGSSSFVWTLKQAGAELLCLLENKPLTSPRKQVFEPKLLFLNHTLAIAELYTHLATKTDLVKVEFEPDCWRKYTTAYGFAILKPDLFAVTTTGDYADYWFFEVDLDTEAPTRILKKCESYGRYFCTGREQAQSGIFPKVAWIVPDDKRKKCISRHISENLAEYEDLFIVIIFSELDKL